MQHRVSVVVDLVDDMVVRARDKFSYHRGGEHLLNLERLSLIHECRDCNRSYVVRNGHRVTSGVVAASRAKKAEQHGQSHSTAHWILPRGRVAAIVSAHSTSVFAAMRKLSDAGHSQAP